MRIVTSLLALVASAILLTGASYASETRAPWADEEIGCWICYQNGSGTVHRCADACTASGGDNRCAEACDHGGLDGPGGCIEAHRACGLETLVENGDLQRAIRAEDASALRVMLAQSDRISFNAERGLVQVSNCKGALVQQYPLTAQVRIVLAEE